jgi:Xaa-Pro dipeptidase
MGPDALRDGREPTEDALWTARLPVEALEAGRIDLYRRRHAHVLAHMRRAGAAALLLLDSNDITYATGARNMTLFTMRTPARYLLMLESGHTVLFEYTGCEHLARHLPTIHDIRPAEGLDIVSSGERVAQSCARFAAEIAALIRDMDPGIDRIHLDRFPWQATDALRPGIDGRCRFRAIRHRMERR